MTGRKGRVVCTDDGISYESRSEADVPLEILNLTEKQRFMDGEKVGLLKFAADDIFKFSRFYYKQTPFDISCESSIDRRFL